METPNAIPNIGEPAAPPAKPQHDLVHRTTTVPTTAADDLATRFTYHAPKPGQPEKYVRIRDEAKQLATTIVELTPQSREQALALTHLEEAVFWANAAIARRG